MKTQGIFHMPKLIFKILPEPPCEEAKQRQDRMLAAGHQIPSDDEAQATLDATLYSMERDTEND